MQVVIPFAATAAAENIPSFDDFWCLYPRKVAKKAARRSWEHIHPGLYVDILVSLAEWRRVWLDRIALEGTDSYVPHGSTWLNGERWEDELPLCYRQTQRINAMQSIMSAPAPRTEMPDALRELLRQLRGPLSAT